MYANGRLCVNLVQFIVVAASLFFMSPASAQCQPDEILVRETATEYVCRRKAVYTACIVAAGQQLHASRPACGAKIRQCFRNEGYMLGEAGLTCVLGCFGSLLNLAGCAGACGIGGAMATDVLEKCGVNMSNECAGDALAAHRQAVENCRR